jgi:hypothetical protein
MLVQEGKLAHTASFPHGGMMLSRCACACARGKDTTLAFPHVG